MAMTTSGLKSAILAELVTIGGFNTTASHEGTNWVDKFAEALAIAVVEYIQANAITSPGGETIL
jgi:hypothetical protein